MRIALDWFSQPAYRLLTLALLHFAWQGLAIGLALVVLVELCNVRQAASRYACSLAALLTIAICPVVTIAWLRLTQQADLASGSALSEIAAYSFTGNAAWTQRLEIVQPYVLFAWVGGVALFGSRLLVGFIGVARLRRGRLPLPI